jgi:hypothetical protein
MFKARFLFCIISVSFTASTIAQSCIVYKKENDGIFIGADTRLVSYVTNASNQRVEPSVSSFCKIMRIKDYHIAATGIGADVALQEAATALQRDLKIDEAVDAFAMAFGQKLADILEKDRRTKPDFFKKKFLPGTNLGGAVFVYYNKGVLVGRVVKAVVVSPPSEVATVSRRIEMMDSIGIVGSAVATRNILYNRDVWKKGAVNGIKNIVGIEKMANPTEFDGTVDILFISNKNDTEWVQGKRCR